ncbi:MAG: DNA repair protein [Clostridiales bacterium]|nr:DNA repair protein [Clostridiales bacterium]
MAGKQRTYYCIDMKTFYASVECAERGLNPFDIDLVVADLSRGKNALCLAVSPKLKAQGVRNRCRLSEIPNNIEYIVAPPRMKLYVDYAADIYDIYLDYISPDDIHVYSIDEAFIDATDYLKIYKLDKIEFAQKLVKEIAARKHIPATAGIGTNLFLAKIALDITAKKNKSHIGYLDEEIFKQTLWNHKPITDFWQIADGTAKRLARYAIYDMHGVASAPVDLLYKEFGVNAELLIDHAFGRESCTIADIKSYKSKAHSVSFSQILPRDYSFAEARIVMEEMAMHGMHELMRRHVVTDKVGIGVNYSRSEIEGTGGAKRLGVRTALGSVLTPAVMEIYDKTTSRTVPIRRLSIDFENVVDESYESYDLFTDMTAVEKEKSRERAVLGVKSKYGKNAILMGTNFLDCATQRERNTFIGGHRAGDDESGKS